jgi:hypothetical protein
MTKKRAAKTTEQECQASDGTSSEEGRPCVFVSGVDRARAATCYSDAHARGDDLPVGIRARLLREGVHPPKQTRIIVTGRLIRFDRMN